MTLRIAKFPEDVAALPGWLERQIAGPALGELAAELTAIHGEAAAPASVRALLGGRLPNVLDRGLSDLPSETLRTLLRRPALLLELQEIVLTEGGAYWDRLLTDAEIDRAVNRTGLRLRVALGLAEPQAPGKQVRLRFYRRPWLVALATAAAVLAGVYISWPFVTGLGRWGWNRPGALTQDGTPSSYLKAVADAAAEWQQRPKNDKESLVRTLREMRDGCTRVLAAEHRPLADKDRQWLVGKCRAWGAKLDEHLADLQTDKDWQTVRSEADETVERLIHALRERAAQIEGA